MSETGVVTGITSTLILLINSSIVKDTKKNLSRTFHTYILTTVIQ